MGTAVVSDDIEPAADETLDDSHTAGAIVGDTVKVDQRRAPPPLGATVPSLKGDLVTGERFLSTGVRRTRFDWPTRRMKESASAKRRQLSRTDDHHR